MNATKAQLESTERKYSYVKRMKWGYEGEIKVAGFI